MADMEPRLSEVVAISNDGVDFRGTYDGYGRLIGNDGEASDERGALVEDIESGRVKLVLAHYYKDEPFDLLGKCHWDPGQGHFHDRAALERWHAQGGFSSHEEFLKAYAPHDWRQYLSSSN